MRTIGLIGGMSWESSIEYERIIHEEVRDRLGTTHSAKTLHWTFDFHEIEALQEAGDWDAAASEMVRAAAALRGAGADLLLICTNTMHLVFDAVQEAVDVPVLHIADATAAAIGEAGLGSVGLLGTAYTMEHPFYRGRLEDRHGLGVLIPGAAERADVHRIIYDELVRGEVRSDSRERYLEVIGGLVSAGAEGIIAGCTEVELLVHTDDLEVPYFPTARLHALAAVDAALA
ncbi:MAG: amino acid racemase [Acidimicrobiia bacterium]|nr:amino acid racemase [Acidimicrobiia bacterium]